MSDETEIDNPLDGAKVTPFAKASATDEGIVRESPQLVAARDELAGLIRVLDDEIALAQRASSLLRRDASLTRFVRLLASSRAEAVRLHALAYANTLEQRYDAIQPQIALVVAHARSVGLVTTK